MLEALYQPASGPDVIVSASVGATNSAFIASRRKPRDCWRAPGDLARAKQIASLPRKSILLDVDYVVSPLNDGSELAPMARASALGWPGTTDRPTTTTCIGAHLLAEIGASDRPRTDLV